MALALVGVGCTAGPTPYPASSPPDDLGPITVATIDLRPMVSLDGHVVASPVVAVLAPAAGVVTGLAEPGTKVAVGATVARIGGAAVTSPVAGVVVRTLTDSGQSVPQNLPLVSVRYAGFALSGTPTRWAQGVLYDPGATARGQVTDGPGPFDCVAIVPTSGGGVVEEAPINPDDPFADLGKSAGLSSQPWLCLLPKDVVAAEGQSGVVVVSGTAAIGVVAVPISAVAGRTGTGQVSLVTDSGTTVVEVKLGRTDGTNIEVTDGLKAGDRIAAIAPDLSAKGPA